MFSRVRAGWLGAADWKEKELMNIVCSNGNNYQEYIM
jgi:hypothetical protein